MFLIDSRERRIYNVRHIDFVELRKRLLSVTLSEIVSNKTCLQSRTIGLLDLSPIFVADIYHRFFITDFLMRLFHCLCGAIFEVNP